MINAYIQDTFSELNDLLTGTINCTYCGKEEIHFDSSVLR